MVLIIAHRGFSGKYPENTLLAIRKAVEFDVDWVEIDVHLSKDQQAIVMHDLKLNRTTTGNGKIKKKTLEEIRTHTVKKGNQHIPTLEEVFPLITGRVKLNIEVKNLISALKVIKLIQAYNMQDKVIFSSYSVSAIRLVKHKLPSVKTALVFYSSDKPKKDLLINFLSKLSFRITHLFVIKAAEFAKVDYIHLAYPFATKRFVKKLKKKGYSVNVWAVNTPPLMRKLIKNGADGIMTNYPNRLKRVLAEKPRRKKKLLKRISLRKIRVLRKLRKKKK
jgi:glycerophosphoryl diester phosphodiesterase